jgi:hypothetical protein
MGQLLACGGVGNNLAQEWHFSTEMFKHFLAAAQKAQRHPLAHVPLTTMKYPDHRLSASDHQKGENDESCHSFCLCRALGRLHTARDWTIPKLRPARGCR